MTIKLAELVQDGTMPSIPEARPVFRSQSFNNLFVDGRWELGLLQSRSAQD